MAAYREAGSRHTKGRAGGGGGGGRGQELHTCKFFLGLFHCATQLHALDLVIHYLLCDMGLEHTTVATRLVTCSPACMCVVIVIIDRFYAVLFSAIEQTRCM